MQTNIPTLFVEINEQNYIFVAGKYDENQKFKMAKHLCFKLIQCVLKLEKYNVF